MESDLEKKINLAAKWIAESERLVVFTGAGISTDSGLPDFRGPDGMWTRRDAGLPPPKSPSWDQVQPNQGHYLLVELLEMGKLLEKIAEATAKAIERERGKTAKQPDQK